MTDTYLWKRGPSLAKSSERVEVVVCIPTFRREKSLVSLLKSLSVQDIQAPFVILIADNDAEFPSAPAALEQAELELECQWFCVQEAGVSAIRNALLERAIENYPEASWVAFLDDDERVPENWLSELVRAGSEFHADLVGGPVYGSLPQDCSRWARHSLYARHDDRPPGLTNSLNATNNLLISCSFIRNLDRVPFLPALGLSGGEDYEFFKYCRRKGAKFAWTNAAVAWEEVNRERLAVSAILHRYFAMGAYQGQVDLRYLSHTEHLRVFVGAWRRIVQGFARALFGSPEQAIKALYLSSATAGRLAGLLGLKLRMYGRRHAAKSDLRENGSTQQGLPRVDGVNNLPGRSMR